MRTMKWIRGMILATAVASGGVAVADQAPTATVDASFLTQALATNRIELALGQLAIDRAATPAVRDMGKKMVQRHTELGQTLGERAAAAGVTAPEESATDKATVARLAALPSDEFDGAFKQTVDDIHRRELAFYEVEAKSASSPELRALAEQRVTTLRQNLVGGRPGKKEKDW